MRGTSSTKKTSVFSKLSRKLLLSKFNRTDFASRAESFRWQTNDGQVLDLDEMTTVHMFNSMKMIFNHLAHKYGVKPVWFTKRYPLYEGLVDADPERCARTVGLFCWAILRVGDLPDKYDGAFKQIVGQILGNKKFKRDALTLVRAVGAPRDQLGVFVDPFGSVRSTVPFMCFDEVPNFGFLEDDDSDPWGFGWD